MDPGEMTGRDEDRVVDLFDDELVPESTGSDAGWGTSPPGTGAHLLDERPPHWA